MTNRVKFLKLVSDKESDTINKLKAEHRIVRLFLFRKYL